jgi:hypothetical protein
MRTPTIHVVAAGALLCFCVGACSTRPSVDEQLQAGRDALAAACPLGSSFQHVTDVLDKQAPGEFLVMSPAECRKHYVEILGKTEACAGGPRVDARISIARDWTGFETFLLVTYLFDVHDQLATAKYEPFHTWL